MNGQYIGKFKMDNYSLIVMAAIVFLFFTLIILSALFRNLINKQIDEQIKDIIPIKAIRERIGIRIKFRK